MIKIDFEITSEDGRYIYRDALHLDDDHVFSDDEINQMKTNRFNNWLSVITAVTDPQPATGSTGI